MPGTQFTGTIGRSITDFMGERLSVLAFGAVGDGVTDDAPAINKAIQNLTTLSGRKLFFPGGRTYLIQSPIVVPAGLSQMYMVGDGDSTLIKRGSANMPNGQGMLDVRGASKVVFDSFRTDASTTTPTRMLYSDFSSDPMSTLITQNTTFWIHGGSSKIFFNKVTVNHTGGYSILGDATTGGIDDFELYKCLLENNRPHLIALISAGITGNDSNGNLNGFGGFTGGVHFQGDGSSSAVSNVSVKDCTFRRIDGNALWSHAYGLTKLHSNLRFIGNHFEDTGLDAIEMGAVDGGVVDGNTGRRIGYCTFDDTSQSTPRYCLETISGVLTAKNATGLDTSGLCKGVGYKNNTFSSVNGGVIDLDGYSQGAVEGNECRIYASTDAQYTEDQVSLMGPGHVGPFGNYGINVNNSNNDPIAGTDITIEGNTFINMDGGAIRLYAARSCKVMGNKIDHTVNSTTAPIVMGPVGTGPNQRATNIIITDNDIMYNPSSPVGCIQEDPSITPFLSTDRNWVFGNRLLGTNCFEFYKDPNSGSSVRLVFSSGQSTLSDVSINFMQREGSGNSAVFRIYSQEGTPNPSPVLFNLQDYSRTGTLIGNWSSGVSYTTGNIVWFSGARYYAVANSTAVTPGTDITKWTTTSPLLNISYNGAVDTGVISTGNRLTSVVDDAVVTGKLYADSFLALASTTYADADANTVPGTTALLRFKSSVGFIEQSISVSGGARVWSALTGSGGTAVAASPTNGVQFNGGSNLLAASANFQWLGAGGLAITVASGAAITVTGGYVQAAGFVSTVNSWQAFNGAGSGSGAYVAGIISAPFGSTGGYLDLNALGYGSYPVPLSGLSAFGATDVLLWVSTANGTTTALTSVGLNTNTFINAAGGFYTDDANSNAIQAPKGGFLTRYLTLNTPTPTSNQYPTIVLGAGASTVFGRVFGSVVSGDLGTLYLSANLSYSGSAFVTDSGAHNTAMIAMDPGAATPFAVYVSNGGGLGVAGLQIYNNGNVGIQGGASTLAGVALTVTGSIGVAAIVAVNGYMQSDEGYYTPSSSVTAINIPSGGAQFGLGVQLNQGLYLKALGATPTTTVLPHPAASFGCIAYDGGSTYLIWNASTGAFLPFDFAATGGGGVTSLVAGTAISVSSSGSVWTVNNTGVTALAGTTNEVIVSATVGAITLSLPQSINVGANVTFNALALTSSASNALNVTGGIDSSALFCSSSNFNAISATGGIEAGSGSLGGFYVGGAQVINPSRTFVGFGVFCPTDALVCSGINPVLSGTTWTGETFTYVFPSGFTVNGANFNHMVVIGGVIVEHYQA